MTAVLFVEDLETKQQYPVDLYNGPYSFVPLDVHSRSWLGLAGNICYKFDGFTQFCYFDSNNIQRIFVEKRIDLMK